MEKNKPRKNVKYLPLSNGKRKKQTERRIQIDRADLIWTTRILTLLERCKILLHRTTGSTIFLQKTLWASKQHSSIMAVDLPGQNQSINSLTTRIKKATTDIEEVEDKLHDCLKLQSTDDIAFIISSYLADLEDKLNNLESSTNDVIIHTVTVMHDYLRFKNNVIRCRKRIMAQLAHMNALMPLGHTVTELCTMRRLILLLLAFLTFISDINRKWYCASPASGQADRNDKFQFLKWTRLRTTCNGYLKTLTKEFANLLDTPTKKMIFNLRTDIFGKLMGIIGIILDLNLRCVRGPGPADDSRACIEGGTVPPSPSPPL